MHPCALHLQVVLVVQFLPLHLTRAGAITSGMCAALAMASCVCLGWCSGAILMTLSAWCWSLQFTSRAARVSRSTCWARSAAACSCLRRRCCSSSISARIIADSCSSARLIAAVRPICRSAAASARACLFLAARSSSAAFTSAVFAYSARRAATRLPPPIARRVWSSRCVFTTHPSSSA